MTRRAADTTRVAHRGETFALRTWRSPGARTALVIHHGLGEHAGRYQTFADQLAGLPLHVVSYDLRGHGESSGPRGHADGLEALAADFHTLLPGLLAEVGAERAIVLGHSLGAAAVLRWLVDHGAPASVVGLLISAPPLVVPRTLAVRVKLRVGRLLRRLRPSFALGSGIPAEHISSHPPEVVRYREDPFVHDRISAALGVSLLDGGPGLVSSLGRITLPALVWHGTEDHIAHPDGGRVVYEHLGSADKQLHLFEGYRHESHHETPERVDHLFRLLRDWLGPRS
jgi:alpha-beta hydrolase superfamily lysophospholipase